MLGTNEKDKSCSAAQCVSKRKQKCLYKTIFVRYIVLTTVHRDGWMGRNSTEGR